jgi:hypothetical protein
MRPSCGAGAGSGTRNGHAGVRVAEAVLAGTDSVTAIPEWAADAWSEALAALGA